MEPNQNNGITGILDVLNGKESIKFELSLDYVSVAVLLGGVVLVGVLLLWINKRMK